ncbi:MAG: hypothetical protein ACFE9L_03080 [Candidatus Hodarchaeota archaeon]
MREEIIIIGRASPEWRDKYGQMTVCTVGITNDLQWRRLYNFNISDLKYVHNWSIIEVDLEREGVKDPRPETHRILSNKPNYLKVKGKIDESEERREYIEKLVRPSVKVMQQNKETLGIVKPINLTYKIRSIDLEEYKRKKKPKPMSLQRWFDLEEFQKEGRLRRYAERDYEIRFKFRCGNSCETQNPHNMIVLDLELFMLYKHVAKKYDDSKTILSKMKEKIEKEHSTKDVYLGLGTHLYYPFKSYMIGSVMRFKKKKNESKGKKLSNFFNL